MALGYFRETQPRFEFQNFTRARKNGDQILLANMASQEEMLPSKYELLSLTVAQMSQLVLDYTGNEGLAQKFEGKIEQILIK